MTGDRVLDLWGLWRPPSLCSWVPGPSWAGVLGGAGGGVAEITFTDTGKDGTSDTSFPYPARAIGAAAGDRKVVVLVYSEGGLNSATVSSLTVGGISGAAVATHYPTTGLRLEIWQADVPTGTTADVVVNFSATRSNGAHIGVFRVTGAAAAAHDTGGNTSQTAPSDTLDIPANGCAVALAGGNGPAQPITWTGLTERFEDTTLAGGNGYGGASDDFATQQTGLTITATFDGGTSAGGIVMASWGPA